MKSLVPITGERIWAEIDVNHIRENIRLIKEITKGKKVLLAVKADAYGHGAKEIAPHLQEEVDYFGVASVEEGIALRENGTNRTNVLILSPVPYPAIPYLFEYNLIPTVTEENFLRLLTRAAQKRNKMVPVYLEVDTGMGRTGVLPKTAKKIIPEILRNSYIKLVGIFSHFPSADCDFSFTGDQINQFKDFIKEIPGKGKYLLSLANSSGLINFPISHFHMVRPGLLAYGIIPEIITHKESLSPILSKIKPALALYSRIVNLRHLPKGASIGYGRRFILPKDSLIAVVSAGYGDGIPYSLTNRGEVLVKGKRAKIVGSVCMDLFMIDLSEIGGVKIGDWVTIIGENGPERIKVTDVAFWANTIPYEITCRISPRVRRVFKEGEKILTVR